jgi:hypothetical protein
VQITPSLAANLFAELTSADGVSRIQSYPGKQCETEWLDFKSGKAKEADIPRIWSKALGGFANNQGGVLVWGVDARKDSKTGIDTACAIEPVKDVVWLEARLTEFLRYACDPPVPGVQMKSLQLSSSDKQGFVVCFIPESPFRPHRSEQSERRFYLRVGDEAKECSVSILRQLFYPRWNPRLSVRLSPIARPQTFPRLIIPPFGDRKGDDIKATVEVSIRNIGLWSVEHVHLHMRCADAQLNRFWFNKASDKFEIDLIEGAPEWARILHPGMSVSQRVAAASKDSLSEWQFKVLAKDMTPRCAILPSTGLAAARTLGDGCQGHFAELCG